MAEADEPGVGEISRVAVDSAEDDVDRERGYHGGKYLETVGMVTLWQHGNTVTA